MITYFHFDQVFLCQHITTNLLYIAFCGRTLPIADQTSASRLLLALFLKPEASASLSFLQLPKCHLQMTRIVYRQICAVSVIPITSKDRHFWHGQLLTQEHEGFYLSFVFVFFKKVFLFDGKWRLMSSGILQYLRRTFHELLTSFFKQSGSKLAVNVVIGLGNSWCKQHWFSDLSKKKKLQCGTKHSISSKVFLFNRKKTKN